MAAFVDVFGGDAVRALLAAALVALLAGCASGPSPSSSTSGISPSTRPLPSRADGPPEQAPPDLARVPDAEPRVEPIRTGGPNKPYTVLGRSYEPQTDDAPWRERGSASWYGRKFHGRRTASGEIYSMYGMTAAHRTLPIPSYARVRNVANGREVIVRVNDRGPFHADRILDLSYTAALKLGVLGAGTAHVEVERLTFADIRAGAWRRDGVPEVASAAAAAPAPSPVLTVVPTAAPVAAAEVSASALPAAPDADPIGAFAQAGAAPDNAAMVAPAPASSPTGTDRSHLPPEQRARAYTGAAQGFWVQLGAFRQRAGAESFQQRVGRELDALSPLLAIFSEASMFRLQAGPYATREEAHGVAHRVRNKLNLVPVIVERR